MGYLLLEENLFVKHSVINPHSPAGQKIHTFLLARAKLLAGKRIDFENNPVAFVMSDSKGPNAFYAPSPQEQGTPRRDEYENIRYTKNPLDVPVICVTKGLIDMVDNIDQLDYILAHELTHLIVKGKGIKGNSKGEELISDLHAVDLVYDAGSDPKQILKIEDKFHEHAIQHAEEAEKRRRRGISREKETGINWSEILDVHVTHRNTRTALEASLTRLSHLIDQREPREIDKSVFAVEYSDPVTEFLKANNYKNQKAVGKLRVLIDCIDHISTQVPAEEYYQAKLAALSEQEMNIDLDDWDAPYEIKRAKEEIQKSIDGGYKDYFRGKTIEKKYQQKIATLAEDIFEQAEEDGGQKHNSWRSSAIDVKSLMIYLQNKAYQHIEENGYPEPRSQNFFDASGIMYTYFFALLNEHHPNREIYDDSDETPPQVLPQIEVDLENARQRIRSEQKVDAFVNADEDLQRLTKIYKDISSISYNDSHITKLDNLSFINSYHNWFSHSDNLYPNLEIGKPVPWNNLAEIAKTNAEAHAYVVKFLKEQGIEDYQIMHDKPFVRGGYYSCYGVNAERVVSEKRERYELDYALKTDLVLQSYKCLKRYFKNETALFDATCTAVLNLTDADFRKYDKKKDQLDRSPIAYTKAMRFIQLYNSLPQENSGNRRHHLGDYEDDSVLSLISDQYLKENPLPCSDKAGGLTLDDDLFRFDNPIFQQHFGEDFQKRQTERKSALKQKMFDTALEVVKIVADMWAEAAPKTKVLGNIISALWEQKRELKRNDPVIKKIDKKLKALHKEEKIQRITKETTENIVLHYTYSIIDNEEYGHRINRLTSQQKDIVADYIVGDEKGIFSKLLGAERYASFCNSRNVLSRQIERIISGDYELTDVMHIVANNLGYEKAETKEALEAFVDIHYKNKWRVSKYVWYLHLFDAMQYLEKSPEINLCNLAKVIDSIEVSNPDRHTDRSKKFEREEYQNYAKFVRGSNLPKLIAKAVGFQGNYNGLSIYEILETVDDLISLRKQMARIWAINHYDKSDRWYGEKKVIIAPKHKKVLNALDKNIRSAIRKAQSQALQKDNALEKIIDLYCLYNANEESYSFDLKRSSYIKTIAKKEKTLEKISALSEKTGFWPEDVLDHVKAHVFARHTFLDDVALENRLLNDILDKLETSPAGEEKKECFYILLDKNLRASYPETRERLFTLYSDDILAELGRDDGSKEYQEKLSNALNSLDNNGGRDWDIGKKHGRSNLLSNSLSAADKYMLLRRVSDKILSQEETSDLIRKACQLNLKSEDLLRSYLYGVGVDYLTAEMDRDPDTARKFIQFLNSKGESRDCNDMSKYIEGALSKEDRSGNFRGGKKEILANTRPINCKILYENFWSAPLEARAVVIARVLKCAVNGQGENENKAQQSWERVFDLVMDSVIRPDDTSVGSKYARDIMHSYIKARSDYERDIILSAMMVANRNIGADAGNVGKALRLFLENMGPAEIKLGQAVASHPSTPESIRKELQNLKNMADVPPRWTLYNWIRSENLPEELWKDKYLGEVLGSASYYTTIALGDNDVIRILRPEAREKAVKGFKVISDMVTDLQGKDLGSDLDYRELTASVAEMVAQAARMAKIETDQEIGQKQYEYAQEIYNGVKINSGDKTFSLKVMDWKARGQNWVIMHRAKGPVFNDLPEDTLESLSYKKDFAKAYIVFEMRKIISGRKFDHDRHGAQLCIDDKTNEVGIFDTGAMALRDSTVEEQKQFGQVIYDVAKKVYGHKQDSTFGSQINVLGAALSDKIEELHKANIDTQHLIEVKKGILALGDLFKVLDKEDAKCLVSEIDIYSHISEHTRSELLKRMSLSEKAQLKLLLASNPISRGNKTIVISQAQSETTGRRVTNFPTTPNMPNKADWLQQIFAP